MTSPLFRSIAGSLLFIVLVSSVSAKTGPVETSKDKVCRQAIGNVSNGAVTDPKRQSLRETDVAAVFSPGMTNAAQEILKKQENYNRTRPQRNRVKWITMDPKKGYRITVEGLRELCVLYATAIPQGPKSWCGGKKCPNWKQGQGKGGGQQNPPQQPPTPSPTGAVKVKELLTLPSRVDATKQLHVNYTDTPHRYLVRVPLDATVKQFIQEKHVVMQLTPTCGYFRVRDGGRIVTNATIDENGDPRVVDGSDVLEWDYNTPGECEEGKFTIEVEYKGVNTPPPTKGTIPVSWDVLFPVQ